LVIFDAWQIAVVPFPFSARSGAKRRPALVLSQRSFNTGGHTVLAMITSSRHDPWPTDTRIDDLTAARLAVPCVVRLKLFTIDKSLAPPEAGLFGSVRSAPRRRLAAGRAGPP
jgi:mRNA interferase MazF